MSEQTVNDLRAVGFYATANDLAADRVDLAEVVARLRRVASRVTEPTQVQRLALADALEASLEQLGSGAGSDDRWTAPFCPDCGRAGVHDPERCTMLPGEPVTHGNFEEVVPARVADELREALERLHDQLDDAYNSGTFDQTIAGMLRDEARAALGGGTE